MTGPNARESTVSEQSSIHMVDGLVCNAAWHSAREGPFTVLSKIACANVLNARELCSSVFGLRTLAWGSNPPRKFSLLAGAWMSRAPFAQGYLARLTASRTLSFFAGAWTQHIADETRLRYCPTCLGCGFQSVVCQITGLRSCPAHGDKLRDRCPYCDAPTLSYALVASSFDVPMHCPHCERAYAEAWKPAERPMRWRTPTDVDAYEPIELWLIGLRRLRVSWPDLAQWLEDRSGQDAAEQKRSAVFATLRLLSPLTLDKPVADEPEEVVGFHSTTPREAPPPSGPLSLDQPAYVERSTIYRAVRRHYARRLGLRRQLRRESVQDGLTASLPHGILASRSPRIGAELHGLLLWRLRFEPDRFVLAALAGLPEQRLELRPAMVRWPQIAPVNDATWAQFALRCLKEDLWTARQWHLMLLSNSPPETVGWSSGWMEHLSRWSQRLSPELQMWPCAVSQLLWSAISDEAPPSMALVWIRRPAVPERGELDHAN